MANIGKPKKRGNRSGGPPQPEEIIKDPINKPSNDERVQLKFDVSAEFRKDYKSFALANDMTMLAVLVESFELYKSKK